ncbi:MAG: hypothetical protein QXD05_00990 [Candidatus Pacearchaeota archaeon]
MKNKLLLTLLASSVLSFVTPDYSRGQNKHPSKTEDLSLYHGSGALFTEIGRDTSAYNQKFVGIRQVGSNNVQWRAEATRDLSTTFASFYNLIYGSDRTKDDLIKKSVALTNNETSPENIKIIRDSTTGYIIDIEGKNWTVPHTNTQGKTYKHALLRRSKIFWIPEEALSIYKSLTPQNIKNLEGEISKLREKNLDYLNLVSNLLKERDQIKKEIDDIKLLGKKLEEKLLEYRIGKEEETLPFGFGFFVGPQFNNYSFKVSDSEREYTVNAGNIAVKSGFKLFANISSWISPEISVSFNAGTEFNSEEFTYENRDSREKPLKGKRMVKPFAAVEVSGGAGIKIDDNARIKFSTGAIKNFPGEREIIMTKGGYSLGSTLDHLLKEWIPTASVGLEMSNSKGDVSVYVGSDFGSTPMKRMFFSGFQWSINTGNFSP